MDSKLIPAPALALMPDAVKEAEARLVSEVEAKAEADSRTVAARAGVQAARQHDAEARAEAARQGGKPPGVTEPKAKAELAAARDAGDLLAERVKQVLIARDRAVRDHQREVIAALAPALEAAVASGHEAVERVRETLDEVATLDAALCASRGADRTVDSHRGRRSLVLGKLRFGRKRVVGEGSARTVRPQPAALLEALDAIVDQFAKPTTETAGERRERERREADERGPVLGAGNQRVGAGVHVP
jgi:hypothetical protein